MLNNHAHLGTRNWQTSGSPADIAIVVIVALIIFGPKSLPELITDLGQAMREMRKITRN